MKKFCGSLIGTVMVVGLFGFVMIDALDPTAFAQTHEDLHSAALDEKAYDRDAASLMKAAEPNAPTSSDIIRSSQDMPTQIVGRVLDTKDLALPRATVTLTEADGTKHTTTSDRSGNFRFENLDRGQKVVLSAGTSQHSFSEVPIDLAGETVVSWRASSK